MFEFHVLILLYNFSYSKAFVNNYERVTSETTERNMCFVFYCLQNKFSARKKEWKSRREGGSLALETRVGGGVTVIQEIRVGGGGSKNLAIRRGGRGWIFSGITQCGKPRGSQKLEFHLGLLF